MKMISLLLLILVSTVHAAPVQKTASTKKANAAQKVTPTPSPTPSPEVTPTPVLALPTPTPNPWKVSYFGEYYGPRVGNPQLSKTQGPLDPAPSYTEWDNSLKLGYAVSKDVVLGAQTRAAIPFDPTKSFTFMDERLYFSWANMIDTPDVNMTGVLDVELSTSAASKNAGKIIAFRIKNNWILKTPLRNWSFSALTMVKPIFYNVPYSKSDLALGFYPTIEWDYSSEWALVINGGFDANHSYNDTFYSYGQGDPDSIEIGPQWTINSHVQVYAAINFFTADFTVPTLYFNISAAL